jgi:hypothetical protein
MADNETAPISVNATPATDQIAAAMRSLVLVVSAITALAGIASKHDLKGFIAYVQSSDFLAAASVVVAVGSFAWSQLKTRKRAVQLATIAADPRVPDAVATVKPA